MSHSSACHELLCSRTFLFIVLRSAQHPQIPRLLFSRGIWLMPLSLLNHSALALFAQRTRIPTSARNIGFCAIWACISSSSSSKAAVQRCRRCIAGSMAVGKGSRDIFVYRIMPSGMASHETLLVLLYTHERIFMNSPTGLLVPNKSRS